MKRIFAHVIIFSLLMISPISFSTTKIPNFYILVTIAAPLQEARKTSIAIVRSVEKSPKQLFVSISPQHSFILLPTNFFYRFHPRFILIPLLRNHTWAFFSRDKDF